MENELLNAINAYAFFADNIIKTAIIRKLPNGKYRVYSHSGRNLGTYNTRDEAKERLRQVEYFKHKKASKELEIDSFSYSAIMRALNKKAEKKHIDFFIKTYKECFDDLYLNGEEEPEKKCLKKTFELFCKKFNIKQIKKEAAAEQGDPVLVGKYLASIIKFTLSRISKERRPISIEKVKHKIYNLNELDLSEKNLPASSSMGQAITFVKHVLFDHNPQYIRQVINSIIRNL